MTTTTHSHKHWTHKGSHVTIRKPYICTKICTLMRVDRAKSCKIFDYSIVVKLT